MTSTSGRTTHISRYFTAEPYLIERFERHGRQMAFRASTSREARAWQKKLRAKVRERLGLDTMQSCDLQPSITERTSMAGWVRERVEVQTEPGITAVLYAFVPEGLKPGERRPLVIAPHGHGSAGKFSPAGRRDIPAVADAIEGYNYAYGESFAREGWVVFCPDARGFGERRERDLHGDEEEQFLHSSCLKLSNMAIPLGQTVAGMWTWDLMRLIDYAASRPDCDMHRVACAGLSGGGLQTLYLTALDERVKCAVDSGYFYGVRDSLIAMSENCSCNYVPGLWLLCDMGDLGALCAPRPLLIETGDEDELNGVRGLPNVIEQVDITRQAYQVFGAGERLHHAVFHGGHRWDGAESLPWLRRWLA